MIEIWLNALLIGFVGYVGYAIGRDTNTCQKAYIDGLAEGHELGLCEAIEMDKLENETNGELSDEEFFTRLHERVEKRMGMYKGVEKDE